MISEIGDTSVDLADTAAKMAKDAQSTVIGIVKLVGDDAVKLARPNWQRFAHCMYYCTATENSKNFIKPQERSLEGSNTRVW
jgi:hypothetical protein